MPANLEVGLRRSTLPLGPLQPRRLLDTIERLPAIEGGNPLRWLEGVTWEPQSCDFDFDFEPDSACSPEDFADDPQECQEWVTQLPFRISLAIQRSSLDYTAEMMADRLEARYNRIISAAFASSLLKNADTTISLSNTATAPSDHAWASGVVSVKVGFRLLEQEIAARLHGTVGYIHVSPGLLGEFVMQCGVRLNGDHWETPAGNIVISDAGYYDPPPPAFQGAATGSQDWAYTSGPVFYESTAPTILDPVFVGKTGGAHDTTPWNRDLLLSYLAGYGILVFDPCPVTAVAIDYTV